MARFLGHRIEPYADAVARGWNWDFRTNLVPRVDPVLDLAVGGTAASVNGSSTRLGRDRQLRNGPQRGEVHHLILPHCYSKVRAGREG
jgi:hypothetical protein